MSDDRKDRRRFETDRRSTERGGRRAGDRAPAPTTLACPNCASGTATIRGIESAGGVNTGLYICGDCGRELRELIR